VVAHVEIDTYPFQITLRNTYVMLLKIILSHVLSFESLIVQSYP
jgi:hypothetical protein